MEDVLDFYEEEYDPQYPTVWRKQFTSRDARVKLERLYPVKEPSWD